MLVGVAGGSLIQITAANAATTTAIAASNQSGTQNQPPSGGQFDPSKGGHTANGITEKLLTGDTAEVTVKMDGNFKVTGIETGQTGPMGTQSTTNK